MSQQTISAPEGFERELGPGGLEVRTVPGVERLEARATGDGVKVIRGYGAVYEEATTIEGWFSEWDEEIASGAGAKTISESDIRSMFNHDTNWLLGRNTSGSLTLSEDATGLLYDVTVNPDDVNALSVWAKVDRGDVSGSSIWFKVRREEWTYPDKENGLERAKRRITEYQLFETGPVVFPAFVTTTAATRALSALDTVLRSAGITQDGKRARAAADLLADPTSIEAELRSLLSRQPELRDAVCSCPTSRAADEAPGSRTGTPPVTGHLPTIDQYDRRARGLAARYGLALIPGGSPQ